MFVVHYKCFVFSFLVQIHQKNISELDLIEKKSHKILLVINLGMKKRDKQSFICHSNESLVMSNVFGK